MNEQRHDPLDPYHSSSVQLSPTLTVHWAFNQTWFQFATPERPDCVMFGADYTGSEFPTNPLTWRIIGLKYRIVLDINEMLHITSFVGLRCHQNNSFVVDISAVFACKLTYDSIQQVFWALWEWPQTNSEFVNIASKLITSRFKIWQITFQSWFKLVRI
jgi:hypothetical protein